MYKVFFNDRIIFIGASSEGMEGERFVFKPNNSNEVSAIVSDFLNAESSYNLFMIHPSVDELFSWFCNSFEKIDAAGGIVTNDKDELLCIHRLGKWDLPKGKVEKGESTEEAALREVEEECGIDNLKLQQLVCTTQHIYIHPRKAGVWVLKTTYWYDMKYCGGKSLKPQTEEDIDSAVWISSSDVDKDVKPETYASLQTVFEYWLTSRR